MTSIQPFQPFDNPIEFTDRERTIASANRLFGKAMALSALATNISEIELFRFALRVDEEKLWRRIPGPGGRDFTGIDDFIDNSGIFPWRKSIYHEKKKLVTVKNPDGTKTFNEDLIKRVEVLCEFGVSTAAQRMLLETEVEIAISDDGTVLVENEPLDLSDKKTRDDFIKKIKHDKILSDRKREELQKTIDEKNEVIKKKDDDLRKAKAFQKGELLTDPYSAAFSRFRLEFGALIKMTNELPLDEKEVYSHSIFEDIASQLQALSEAFNGGRDWLMLLPGAADRERQDNERLLQSLREADPQNGAPAETNAADFDWKKRIADVADDSDAPDQNTIELADLMN